MLTTSPTLETKSLLPCTTPVSCNEQNSGGAGRGAEQWELGAGSNGSLIKSKMEACGAKHAANPLSKPSFEVGLRGCWARKAAANKAAANKAAAKGSGKARAEHVETSTDNDSKQKKGFQKDLKPVAKAASHGSEATDVEEEGSDMREGVRRVWQHEGEGEDEEEAGDEAGFALPRFDQVGGYRRGEAGWPVMKVM